VNDLAGVARDPTPQLHRITDHLYVYEDYCLVYLLVDGEHAILVESGPAEVVDLLPELGIRQVDWVLHTHHHRDGCWGDRRLVEMGARLAVPEREAHLFEAVEDYWQHLTVFDNYYIGSDSHSLTTNVPVSTRLTDYGTFTWRQYVFQVVPTPGHTQGSISLLTEVDGLMVAFTGDLVASAGRLWQVHALQWQYGGGWGDAAGIQATALSLAEVMDQGNRIMGMYHRGIDLPVT
jgi:glyoxylase-like metal-dependent hydrolase (beta-lactamase superfamily II)